MAGIEPLQSIRFPVDDRGRPLAVQIGIREWAELLEWLEDQEDRAVVKEALSRLRVGPVGSEAVSWEKVQAEWDSAEAGPDR